MAEHYSLLRGMVDNFMRKPAEMRVDPRSKRLHYFIIVRAGEAKFTVSIPLGSEADRVKTFVVENAEKSKFWERLGKVSGMGLYRGEDLPADCRLDYVRSGMLSVDEIQKKQT